MLDERIINAIDDGDIETFVRLMNRHNVYDSDSNSYNETYIDVILCHLFLFLEPKLVMLKHILECGYNPNVLYEKCNKIGVGCQEYDSLLEEYGLEFDRKNDGSYCKRL